MQRRLKLGVLYSRVRVEEKWIFGAMEKRGIDYHRLDDRAIHFDLNHPEAWQEYDAVLERSISYNSGLYALRLLNAFGVPTVNTASAGDTNPRCHASSAARSNRCWVNWPASPNSMRSGLASRRPSSRTKMSTSGSIQLA